MKPNELKSEIKNRFEAGIKRSLYIVGSPGIGKTQVPAQAAKELGIGFMAIHAPLLQPEDYGFPVINSNRDNVDFVVSQAKFPIEGSPCPEKGILLIDELPQCDNSTQKILANLLQEREIHGKHIKPGWSIAATGNRVKDRSGASRLLSHLGARVCQVEVEVSLDDWTQWALDNGVKPEVISFIRFKTELLNAFDPQVEVSPTPRAWAEGVSAAIGVSHADQEFEVFKGDVGEGAAAEFCAFVKICRRLPLIDAILVNPEKAEVPDLKTDKMASATLYALCGSLAFRVTADNFARLMLYVGRMPAEFSVLFIKDALKRVPAIAATPAFIKWAAGPGSKLLS